MEYKAVIWGIGQIYNRMVNVISFYEMKQQLKIVALTASTLPPYPIIDGHPVVEAEKVKHLDYDLLIVMNAHNFHEIVKDAVTIYKVPREKIIPYWVMELSGFDFDKYLSLKESNISIISNNCWGGIAYKTLGMEARSPFKNLFVEDEDYIKLLTNLKYYMECKPIFYQYSVDVHSQEKYPILLLDDVKIHCNHEKEAETAIEKWNRRKEKLNWDNLFVEMYTDNPEVEEAFQKLEGFSQRICFVPYMPQYKDSFQLKLMHGQREFWEAVNGSVTNGRDAFAYHLIDILQMNPSGRVRSR